MTDQTEDFRDSILKVLIVMVIIFIGLGHLTPSNWHPFIPPVEIRELRDYTRLRADLMRRIQASPDLRRLANHVSFTESEEGLRIDLIVECDAMQHRKGCAADNPSNSASFC